MGEGVGKEGVGDRMDGGKERGVKLERIAIREAGVRG